MRCPVYISLVVLLALPRRASAFVARLPLVRSTPTSGDHISRFLDARRKRFLLCNLIGDSDSNQQRALWSTSSGARSSTAGVVKVRQAHWCQPRLSHREQFCLGTERLRTGDPYRDLSSSTSSSVQPRYSSATAAALRSVCRNPCGRTAPALQSMEHASLCESLAICSRAVLRSTHRKIGLFRFEILMYRYTEEHMYERFLG